MKQKKYFILAVAAALMVGCSSDDQVVAEQDIAQMNEALEFGAYINRTTTRAGLAGDITTAALQASTDGFGIFGYYTADGEYTQNATPNFMYNQQVKYNAGETKWEYSPLKYWPNEHGSQAVSDDVEKLSFFAYAPFVNVDIKNGVPTADKEKGITQLTKNTATGDPIVKYIVDTDPTKTVDLLWGVVPATTNYSAIENAPTLTAGLPYVDLTKPAVDSKVNFEFKHALAKFNVQIDAFVDGTDATNALDANTKIYVRSISFSGMALKGALNLNNTSASQPYWLDYDASKDLNGDENVVFNDGRKEGKEGTENGEQKSEMPSSLNAQLIQNQTATTGVTNTAQNLFNNTDATKSIFVIPTNEKMDVTIVYDVETVDPSLPGYLSDGTTHGSSIENKIQKLNIFGDKLEAGKAYTLKLHLGMTSAKFEATVSDWATGSSKDVDLPKNK